MEGKNACEKCCAECSHCCGHHGHGGHMMKFGALRIVLGVILLAIVFGFGMKIGELKGQLEGQYGMSFGRHTQGIYSTYGAPMMGTNYGYGMMQWQAQPEQGTSTK